MCEEKNKEIEVKLCNFIELFKNRNIKIPEYQREYVWDTNNINNLLKDIENHFEIDKEKEYFLGSILLHYEESENKFEVIDGQQRLITLSMIYNTINKNEKIYFEIFSSIFEKSKNNIYNNNEYIKTNITEKIKIYFNDIKFTVIITKNQDDAFTFFDTHNTSGVRLKTVDLLKAYHLRALKLNDKNEIYEIVERWDKDNSNDRMVKIIEDVLFTLRTSKGSSNKYLTKKHRNEDYVLNEFKFNNNNNEIEFYPSNKNMCIKKLQDNTCYIKNLYMKNLNNSNDKYDLPFLIRQHLNDGLSFFLYSGKYKKMYKYLFEEENKIKKLYETVYKNNKISHYLLNIFEYLIILYYDKYEKDDDNLLEFAEKITYIISYYRLTMGRIYGNIYRKIIIDIIDNEKFDEYNSNLLDIICINDNSYSINKYLDHFIEKKKIVYEEVKDIKNGRGVKYIHFNSLKNYNENRKNNIFEYIKTIENGIKNDTNNK